MHTRTTRPAPAGVAFTPPANKQELIAEYIGHILAGRPFPEAVRAPVAPAAPCATVQEGIERILRGTAAVERG